MNEESLCELEIALLNRRLRHLIALHPTGSVFSALAPNLIHLIESDHWSFLASLSGLYVLRETYSSDREAEIAKAFDVSGPDDHDDDEEEEDEEDGFDWHYENDEPTEETDSNERKIGIEEKAIDTPANTSSSNSYSSHDA